MSEEPPRRERIAGQVAGQKFAIETQHLISVLLIIVIAGAMYFQIQHTAELLTQMQRSADAQIESLHDQHEQMFERMRLIGNALRAVDWNQNRAAADRVPIDLPTATFEQYRQEKMSPEEARRSRPRPPLPP